jgi:hypothetical protein
MPSPTTNMTGRLMSAPTDDIMMAIWTIMAAMPKLAPWHLNLVLRQQLTVFKHERPSRSLAFLIARSGSR